MHERTATQLNEILEGTKETPSWMTYGSAMSKGSSKGKLCGDFQTNNLSSAYVEITYRYYFRGYVLFHGKRKLTSRGAKQLQVEMQGDEATDRQRNLAIAWIDYRKAYDFVPHSWILECLDILGIVDNVRSFLEKSMKKWKLLLSSNGSYKWYEHYPEGVVEDDDVKLIWNINMQCNNVMEARRPDLILVDKKAKSCVIIDAAIPGD